MTLDSHEPLPNDGRNRPVRLDPPEPHVVVLGPAQSERHSEPTVPAGQREYRPSLLWAVVLFLLTCLSLWLVQGPVYTATLLTILLCHEMGHFVQARRYGVRSSYPLFIPMPLSPIGTMGAIILMRSNIPNRKALFDIGITGPLAGLVPALAACVIGIYQSPIVPVSDLTGGEYIMLGEPLIFKALTWLIKGPRPEGHELVLNSVAFAGWVGIFITALNLAPISQLDGGHVLYALLGRRSRWVALGLYLAALGTIGAEGLLWQLGLVERTHFGWLVVLMLILVIGPVHPPTRDDRLEIGRARRVLGWLTLPFFFLGFTPDPLQLGP